MKHNQIFNSITCDIQGNLFLPDQIQKVFLCQHERQQDEDYELMPGITLKEECSRAFRIAKASWDIFKDTLVREDLSVAERFHRTQAFAERLLKGSLNYDLHPIKGIELEGSVYPLAFEANGMPVAVAPAPMTLDQTCEELAMVKDNHGSKKSAFQLVQSFLNAANDRRWGMAFNGCSIRLVRDSMRLTRPSYLEFNLQEILSTDDYAGFMHFWEAMHASRSKVINGQTAWDLWIKAGEDAGQPARDALSASIKEALTVLGTGFLQEPHNEALRMAMRNGEVTSQGYIHELLHLMYRFLFLFCLEERDLLNVKDNVNACERYMRGYALHRFRDMALKQRFQNEFGDAWESVLIVFKGLEVGEERLALPALGGLFTESQCSHLMKAKLSNKAFFQAMKLMRWATINCVFAPIDYKNMGTEELCSIYESLLELVPVIDVDQRSFGFLSDAAASSERKNSGSYYTPDPFVQNLIKTALDPVIEKKLKDTQNPETALLSLRVIDPACGSGHFLLAAARRIAEHLAQVRSSEGAITPKNYRLALREVVQHCIYGVDMNPLAVELARMALWLEGYAEGRPLSFLDHHLKVGNSLVGVFNLQDLKKGISRDAYKQVGLDHKETCSYLSKRNATELKRFEAQVNGDGTLDMFFGALAEGELRTIEEMESLSLADEEKKAVVYEHFVETVKSDQLKVACDLQIAAYLSPKNAEMVDLVPTTDVLGLTLFDFDNLRLTDRDVVRHAKKVCEEAMAFHWPLEFPLVFADGGFDCVLGNPPWEKAKVEDVKWFANRYPDVAGAKTAAIRKNMIKAMAEGILGEKFFSLPPSVDRSRTEKELYANYMQAQHRAATATNFCHLEEEKGGRFPMTGVGDTNLFAYFAELALSLRKNNGSVGLVLPAGIITDSATQAYSQYIFDGRVRSLYHFANTEKLFPIHSSYTFLLMTLFDSDKTDCIFYAENVLQLEDQTRHVEFQTGDLKLFNPNTQTCVLARSQKDIELCRKIYQASPVFIKNGAEGGNPWHIRTMRMFDMTNDSGLFHEKKEAEDYVPLYEGKLFHQFDHRWTTYEIGERLISQDEKRKTSVVVNPKFWVKPQDVQARYIDRQGNRWWTEAWMIAFRDISSPTNERTLIASVLPSHYAVGNTAPLLFPKQSVQYAACLLANLNSLMIDFVQRIKQSSTHVNIYYLNQLPIFAPSNYSEQDCKFIVPRVARLTRNAEDINSVWLTEYPAEQYQEPQERLKIRAELDAYYARLYGLNRDELQYILDPSSVMGDDFPSVTFPGLKRNEMTQFGEYLTQKLVLEAFDALENGTLK